MSRDRVSSLSDAFPVEIRQNGAQPSETRSADAWNDFSNEDSAMRTPFTGRHISASPLAEMPTLRFERAPLQPPEYRGVTPRAALHRRQARQTMLLALYELSIRGTSALTEPSEPEREPPIWPWSVGSLTVIVLLCVALSSLR